MKILLLGKNGQVGWELRRTLAPLGSIQSLGSADLNFTDPKALRESVLSSGADLIVNAAAYTAVDKAESQPEVAFQVNGVAPGIIAEAARELRAGLIQIQLGRMAAQNSKVNTRFKRLTAIILFCGWPGFTVCAVTIFSSQCSGSPVKEKIFE